ncbi:cation transporter [Rhodoplanes sp. Z2-YC6860]|uniref:cation transporter n=1 Tax=Rhodoplanes sp. Z2-YC6860 TaxID=674703 RepID=UPI00078C8155|nr:cation transporter [Rhodoplanes sp. Z2-YC6860]AMN42940.1 cobalt-zinc-cadmium resistance protein CzcD [Rhodoplanes sp. Z2-YC6860]
MTEKKTSEDCCAAADQCCAPPPLNLPRPTDKAAGCSADACCASVVDTSSLHHKRVLWAALAINAAMFAVEIGAGLMAGSASLQADALDFLSDAANYALSLTVVGMSLRARASAALVKGVSMGGLGLWVLAATAWHAWHQTLPEAYTMGAVGFAALLANAASFALLWKYRDGDANMNSAWICTRNDVLGNCAVLLAALGVFGTSAGWPDLVVATIMAALGLQGAIVVIRRATGELTQSAASTAGLSAG